MYRNLRRYESMRDNVRAAYNTLSNADIQDNLETAILTLKTNYVVDNAGFLVDDVIKVKNELSECLKSLGEIVASANYNVSKLSSDLNEAEAGGN